MTGYDWPDPQAVVDHLRVLMERDGAELRIADPEALVAGFERARQAHAYEPDASPFRLAALMFEGIATRHPLVDGNKRLAWLGAIVFLDLNGWYLDAPEVAAFEAGMAAIRRERPAEDLAAFLERWSVAPDTAAR